MTKRELKRDISRATKEYREMLADYPDYDELIAACESKRQEIDGLYKQYIELVFRASDTITQRIFEFLDMREALSVEAIDEMSSLFEVKSQ